MKDNRRSIVFSSFAGEEQGLEGSSHFVQELQGTFPGKKVIAVFNFDIVGGDNSVNDENSMNEVRLFAPLMEPHRKLALKIQSLASSLEPSTKVILIPMADRPGRSGDQVSFQNKRIPAVRFNEAVENTSHQHSADDLPKYVSPRYLERIANLGESIVSALADAAD